MMNFLLDKKLTDKEHMLECIKKVHQWQMQEQTSANSFEESVTTVKDLKLDLVQGQMYPSNVQELETYLLTKCTINGSNLIDENEKLDPAK